MSVQRYSFDEDGATNPDDTGDWVRWDDYAALVSQREALAMALENVADIASDSLYSTERRCQKIEQEARAALAAVRKAGK